MEYMIQSENSYTKPIDRLESRVSQMENMYKNEEALPTQFLTILDFSTYIDRN